MDTHKTRLARVKILLWRAYTNDYNTRQRELNRPMSDRFQELKAEYLRLTQILNIPPDKDLLYGNTIIKLGT